MNTPIPPPTPAHLRRLEQRLLSKVARACVDHDLISEGNKVMVCLSGGKDSYVLWHLLERVRARAPFPFDMVAVHLDQHQPGFDSSIIARWLQDRGAPYTIVSRDTYSVVKDKTEPGKAYCSMCSRLRRGILYDTAVELGCDRIALGHHREDTITTLLLNLFYSGQIKAMPPKLHSDDGRNVVIRPLIRCPEDDIRQLAVGLGFPIQPCTVCSSQPDLKRDRMAQLIAELAAENPSVPGHLFHALSNVIPSHLMDDTLARKPHEPVDDPLAALEGRCA